MENGLRAVAGWVMSEGVLSQLLLENEQSDKAEGRASVNSDEVSEQERVE